MFKWLYIFYECVLCRYWSGEVCNWQIAALRTSAPSWTTPVKWWSCWWSMAWTCECWLESSIPLSFYYLSRPPSLLECKMGQTPAVTSPLTFQCSISNNLNISIGCHLSSEEYTGEASSTQPQFVLQKYHICTGCEWQGGGTGLVDALLNQGVETWSSLWMSQQSHRTTVSALFYPIPDTYVSGDFTMSPWRLRAISTG